MESTASIKFSAQLRETEIKEKEARLNGFKLEPRGPREYQPEPTGEAYASGSLIPGIRISQYDAAEADALYAKFRIHIEISPSFFDDEWN